MAVARYLVASCIALAAMAASAQETHACACCTNVGQRHERSTPAGWRKSAACALRPRRSYSQPRPIPTWSRALRRGGAQFDLGVKQEKDRWVFTFRDKDGRSGTLTLAMPKSISVFAVDPRRGEREGGTGPALYREWKLSAPAAGTGIFAAGTGKGQRLTLVLQGHGNSCASAIDFTHWTLDVSGPVATYHLFGKLKQP